MKIVSFQNDGLIDPISICTFGVNAKDTDNPIGYFGTGLKYAIAVLLRKKNEIEIKTGEEVYTFDLENTVIRGKSFDVVRMNGNPVGFTTELGKRWEMWQAFREIYCNAIDEGGNVYDGEIEHSANKTTILVKGDEFYNAFLEKDSIILNSPCAIPHFETDIHSGNNDAVFYKKIRIYKMPRPTLYTYNIKQALDITEDRTAASFHQVCKRLADAIVRIDDVQVIEDILTCDNYYFEHEIDLSEAYDPPSNEFLEEIERLKFNKRLNKSALKVLARYRKRGDPKPAELTDIQTKQLEKATEFCDRIGYNVHNYPIIITGDLTGGVMGLAEKGTIYISLDAFGMGTKYVASTLIEEYLHLKTGFQDRTRELQNLLFNDLVSLGERIIGEPI